MVPARPASAETFPKQDARFVYSRPRPERSSVALCRLLGIGDDVRIQNPTLQKTKGRNQRWYIRPYVPVHTAAGIVAKQQYIYLGSCAEVGKRKATIAKNAAMEKINRHQWVAAVQIPFCEFIDNWLKTYVWAEGNLSSATQNKYESHVHSRIRPAFGALLVGEITTQRVDEWLAAMAKEGISYNLRKDLRNTLSGIFTRARKWGLWKEANPASDATVGRMKYVREKRSLSATQIRALLDRFPTELALICKLALLTLRISEVLALQEKHLDFTSGRIRIRQRYYLGDIDVTKSTKSAREIPMGILTAELKCVCVGDPGRRLFAGWTYNKGASIMRDTAKALGFYWEGFGFHTFRRIGKTGIGAEGLDPFQVMRLAGHSRADESLLYTLNDADKQEQAVRSFQGRILAAEKETVN